MIKYLVIQCVDGDVSDELNIFDTHSEAELDILECKLFDRKLNSHMNGRITYKIKGVIRHE